MLCADIREYCASPRNRLTDRGLHVVERRSFHAEPTHEIVAFLRHSYKGFKQNEYHLIHSVYYYRVSIRYNENISGLLFQIAGGTDNL